MRSAHGRTHGKSNALQSENLWPVAGRGVVAPNRSSCPPGSGHLSASILGGENVARRGLSTSGYGTGCRLVAAIAGTVLPLGARRAHEGGSARALRRNHAAAARSLPVAPRSLRILERATACAQLAEPNRRARLRYRKAHWSFTAVRLSSESRSTCSLKGSTPTTRGSWSTIIVMACAPLCSATRSIFSSEFGL